MMPNSWCPTHDASCQAPAALLLVSRVRVRVRVTQLYPPARAVEL
jgi:hypothetical protein